MQQPPDESLKRVLPEPSQHVNNEIVDFLRHFKSDRLIMMGCEREQARKREDQER